MNASETGGLIDEYGTDVFRFCLKLCNNRPDAEDLYQQTFLKMMELDIHLCQDGNPKALLFSVTDRIWKNQIRKTARHKRIAPCCALDQESENLISSEADTEKAVFSKIRNEELHHIIAELHDKFRVPVILFYLFDFPLEEIGKILKVPAGTVKSRLFKARKLIKKGLEVQGYGG